MSSTLDCAILKHYGKAASVVTHYRDLSKSDKTLRLGFLMSL
jgi:hypothetical protein